MVPFSTLVSPVPDIVGMGGHTRLSRVESLVHGGGVIGIEPEHQAVITVGTKTG